MLRTQSQQERVADIGMARNHLPLAAFHRACAALRAISDRCSGVSFFIRAAVLAFPSFSEGDSTSDLGGES